MKFYISLFIAVLHLYAVIGWSQTLSPPQPKTQERQSAKNERVGTSKAAPSESDAGKTAPSESDAGKTAQSESDAGKTAPSSDQTALSETTSSTFTLGAERRLPNDRVPVLRRAMTRDGATGLYRVYSADPGPQGTLRIGMKLSGFSSSEFLVEGIEDRFSRGDLSIAYTPLDQLEVFINTRSLSYNNALGSPSYIQGQGDLKAGVKVGHFWGIFGAGLSLSAQLVSDPKESGWLGEATNYEVRALLTTDLMRRAQAIPFRFLLDVQFTKENTEALTSSLGEEPSLVQEWGYQSARYDRLMINLGMEVPTQYVSPFVEYHIGTPFLVEMPRMGRYSRVFAFESVPHYLAGGLRGFPLEELAVELGGTLGMSDAPFTGVTATPPWTIWGGVSYTLDPRPKVIEREIKIKPPPAPKQEPAKPQGALLTLTVVDGVSKEVIKGAQLQFLDAEISPQLSDGRGLFKGHRLLPRKYIIQVSAEGYLTKKVRLGIKKGQLERKAQLKLKPDPKRSTAFFSVTYKAPKDHPQANSRLELSLIGPQPYKVILTASTPFKRELKPGDYALIVRDENDRVYQEVITLGSNGEGTREITPMLLKGTQEESSNDDSKSSPSGTNKNIKGATKWVKYNLKRKRLATKRAISFAGDGSKLTRGGKAVVRGLASFLKSEPRIETIVIMVHTHSRGDAKADKRLGYRRGQTIKRLLAAEGVESKRVGVYSYGSEKNVASNLSRRGRNRNQRVLMRIKSVNL